MIIQTTGCAKYTYTVSGNFLKASGNVMNFINSLLNAKSRILVK